jgi:hypothetical protein
MTKLPVGATINEAARFGLKRFRTVFRFLWFPLVLSAALMAAYAGVILDFEAVRAVEEGARAAVAAEIFRAPLGVVLVGGVLVAAAVHFLLAGVMASIFRLVALGEERSGYFHMRFDGPAIRVFLAYLILTAIISTAAILSLAVAALATGQSLSGAFGVMARLFAFGFQAEPGATPPAALVSDLESVAALLGVGWLIAMIPITYLSIKLVPFPAGSAAENRLLLLGAFAMTAENFWRIVAVFGLFIVFVLVISIVFQLAAAIVQLIGGFLLTQGATLSFLGGLLLFLYAAASIVLQALLFGVQTAIPAVIYRRLKTGA